MSAVHDPEVLREFLRDDPRQVWARGADGNPVYIEVGTAEVIRPQAKKEWSCIIPGCVAPITTSGGTRRDHFKHLPGTATHGSGGESQNHLSAKAMIANWATSRLPDGASVREEHSVKDPATAMHRIADVMVTWANGRQTAFEVEYKPYAVAAWAKKDGEYAAKGIPCAWLLGHTKISPRNPPDWERGDLSNAVKVPELGLAIGRSHHILVVNPLSKFIGTMAGDPDFTRPVVPTGFGDGWLALDHIDTCELDPERGIVTPTMRRIDEHEARRRTAEEERQRREEQLAQEQRLRDERLAEEIRIRREKEAVRAAEHERVRERYSPEERKQFKQRKAMERAEAWTRSPFRQRCLDQWGRIPAFLAKELEYDDGVWAAPEHWHCAVFAHLIDTRPIGSTFTVRDVYLLLYGLGLKPHDVPRKRAAAIERFFEHLQYRGYVDFQGTPSGFIVSPIEVLAHLDTPPTDSPYQREVEADRQRARQAQERAAQQAKDARERREAAERAAQQAAAMRAANEQAAMDRERAWHQSSDYHTLRAIFGDDIPAAILWPGGRQARDIATHREHWRMHIYMTHVYGAATGHEFTLADAQETLTRHGIRPETGKGTDAAVREYVENLVQRGFLDRLTDEQISGDNPTFTVIEDHARKAARYMEPPVPEAPEETSPATLF